MLASKVHVGMPKSADLLARGLDQVEDNRGAEGAQNEKGKSLREDDGYRILARTSQDAAVHLQCTEKISAVAMSSGLS